MFLDSHKNSNPNPFDAPFDDPEVLAAEELRAEYSVAEPDAFYRVDAAEADALELLDAESPAECYERVEGDGSFEGVGLSTDRPRSRRTWWGDKAKREASAQGRQLSIYEGLVEYGLLRKLTDIVLIKAGVPWHLRADALQEIHCAWASLKAKPTFERNQLAHYAYLSGQHAAFKLRRSIGAAVTIPGSLFKTGRDSSFMEAIGAVVNPKDVEDYKDSLELSVEMGDGYDKAVVSDELFEQRLEGIELTEKERRMAYLILVRRVSVDDVAQEMGLRVPRVERLLNHLTEQLMSKDAKEAEGVEGPLLSEVLTPET